MAACSWPWVSRSDFWQGGDCSLSYSGVQSTWAAMAAVTGLLFLLAGPSTLRVFRRTKPKRSASDLSVFEVRLLVEYVSTTASFILSCLKASDATGDRAVGFDAATSWFFAIVMFFMFFDVVLGTFEKVRLQANIALRGQASPAMYWNRRLIPLQVSVAVVCSFSGVISVYAGGNGAYVDVFRNIFFISGGVFNVLFMLLLVLLWSSILRSLEVAARPEDASRIAAIKASIKASRARNFVGLFITLAVLLPLFWSAIVPYISYVLALFVFVGRLGCAHHPSRYMKLADKEDSRGLHAQRLFIQHSVVESDFLVMRSTDEVFSQVDGNRLQAEIANGLVVRDDGTNCSVITSSELHLQALDTLAGKLYPTGSRNVIKVLKRILNVHPWAFNIAWALLSVVLLGLGSSATTQALSGDLAFLWLFVSVPLLLALALFVNIKVLKLLLRTSVFYTRATSALVSTLCMVVVLRDARLCVPLLLGTWQIAAALGDALSGHVGQTLRLPVSGTVLVSLVVMVGLLYADLIQVNDFVITLSNSFDYSLVQLARDLYLGSAVVIFFDLLFALRGSNQTRFGSVFRPVKYVLLELKEDHEVEEGIVSNGEPQSRRVLAKEIGGGQARGVSQLEVQSGFLVHQHQTSAVGSSTVEAQPGGLILPKPKRVVKVFVDVVLLKQRDALVVRLLGLKNGKLWLDVLQGRLAVWMIVAASLPCFIAVFIGPLYPATFYGAIALPFATVPREILTSSTNMLALIILRRDFVVSAVFILTWLALALSAFPSVVAMVPLNLSCVSLLDLIKDASVRHSSALSRDVSRVVVGLGYLIFSLHMIFNSDFSQSATHRYVDFRPDTEAARLNGTASYSDGSAVLDLYQQCVDLGLALSAGHIVSGLIRITNPELKRHLRVFKAPIVPVWD